MAEQREGWHAPQRLPIIAAAATLAALLGALLLAAWYYDNTLRPQRRAPVTTFPAPGIDTYTHDGVEDPIRPRPTPRVDPAVTAATRAVLAEGIAGWEPRR